MARIPPEAKPQEARSPEGRGTATRPPPGPGPAKEQGTPGPEEILRLGPDRRQDRRRRRAGPEDQMQDQIAQSPTSSQAHLRQSFYADYFGFHDHPFSLMPDPGLILWSREYRRAFSVLEYGVISGAPITLLTGGIGCGKTTLLRELLTRLDETMTVGLVSNAQGGRGELLQWVLNALGVDFDARAGYVELFQVLRDMLVAEYGQGRRTLLIFDEAQNLSLESLEELRMLTNINYGKDVVLQLVLTGQPELRDLVRQPRLEQLAQRIAVSYDLAPLDAATTADFIRHRLQAVGGTGEEFTPEALACIHRVSRGVPRLINQFCDISLLYAWTADSRRIGPDLLQQVLEDNIVFAAQLSTTPSLRPTEPQAAGGVEGQGSAASTKEGP